MSKAVVPIPVIAVEDPITRLGRPEAFAVAQGGIVNTYQQISANGSNFPSVPSTITFVCPPPSPDILVDRKVYVEVQWRVRPSGTYSGTKQAFNQYMDAPRAFPTMQALQSISAVINNNTITQQMEVIPALMTYNMDRQKQIYPYSGAPSMLDQYPDYGSAIASNRSSLAPSTLNPFQLPRGAWPVTYSNMTATDTQAFGPGTSNVPTAVFTSIEPFFMTPFEQVSHTVFFS